MFFSSICTWNSILQKKISPYKHLATFLLFAPVLFSHFYISPPDSENSTFSTGITTTDPIFPSTGVMLIFTFTKTYYFIFWFLHFTSRFRELYFKYRNYYYGSSFPSNRCNVNFHIHQNLLRKKMYCKTLHVGMELNKAWKQGRD